MAQLNIQQCVPAGLEATLAAANGGGDTFLDDGSQRTFLHVKNGHSAPQTVTIAPAETPQRVPGIGVVTVPSLAVIVTNAEERLIGPFPRAYLGVGGVVNITYSGVTLLTIGAIRLGKAD